MVGPTRPPIRFEFGVDTELHLAFTPGAGKRRGDQSHETHRRVHGEHAIESDWDKQ